MRHAAALTPILLLCLATAVTAAVIHVPADQPTIQAGIDAAVNGDTVLVADGTWSGTGNVDLVLNGKAITVRSENGPAACIIDGNGPHRGFDFYFSGEDGNSVVDGFSIVNADIGTQAGAGMRIMFASPTISNCVIDGNQAGNGGGLYVWGDGTSPLITGCRISGNQAGTNGGGIYISTGGEDWHDPLITNCEITGNHADGNGGGLYSRDYSFPDVYNCLIAGNTSGGNGGGLYSYQDRSYFWNCTFTGNSAAGSGGAVCNAWNIGDIGDGPNFQSCIFWGDSPEEIIDTPDLFWCHVSYSDVQGGYSGTGNIAGNPLFVAGPDGSFYLSQVAAGQATDSPCLDSGADLAGNICFDGDNGTVCLDQRVTRTDGEEDGGQVDMGYHYPAEPPTISVNINCNPVSGTVPFASNLGLMISNQYLLQFRRMAARIDLTLGNGQFFPSWRAGYANLSPGQNLVQLWMQNFPALNPVIGDNVFQLTAEDVTPAPYNQPPYPPAGDTAGDLCTVTAHW